MSEHSPRQTGKTAGAVATNHFSVADWLRYQNSLHPQDIEMGLARVKKVAHKAGILPLKFPVITVAGTNGKGSTVAMLNAIFSAAGYQTACYTSPHIHTYNERIQYKGKQIDDASLCQAFAFIESVRGSTALTFFEYGTLAALHWFNLRQPDIAILEIGLGGRLDAVNIADSEVSIITTIDIDHTEWLGKDRESIGAEKAGVARPGKVCVCGDADPPQSLLALDQNGVVLQRIGKDFGYQRNTKDWSFYHKQTDKQITIDALPLPALFGAVQFSNASCALAAIQALSKRFYINKEHIRTGLINVNLEGRFQTEQHILQGKPKKEFLAVFDIAHNVQGIETLLNNLECFPDQGKTHAIFSVFRTKDVRSMLAKIAPLIDYWYLSQNSSYQALPLAELQPIVAETVSPERIFLADDIPAAYRLACSKIAHRDRLITFGSMVTVSEALRASRLSYNGSYDMASDENLDVRTA